MIGTLNSPCAVAAVPELNRAPGGPLAMVSPLNSFVGLTCAAPGVARTLLASLYPTGRRNFLRVYPTDDLQGAALALLARDRGRRSVYVLDDGEPGYGALLATGFATTADRLGLRIAGRSTWDPQDGSYEALARRVAASARGPSSSAACSTRTPPAWCATCAQGSEAVSTCSRPTGSHHCRCSCAPPDARQAECS